MISSPHTHWLPRLRALGSRLITPAPSITNPQERRNARLLAALLVLTLAILLFGRSLRLFADFKEPPVQVAAIWINILALAISYGLSRTRYHRVGAIATVTVVSTVVYLQMMYRGYGIPGDVSNPAAWLVALMLLSSFVISWRSTLTLGVANLAGLWMLPRIVPSITYLDIRFSFELIFALSLVITLVAYLRRRDWSLIHAQTEAPD